MNTLPFCQRGNREKTLEIRIFPGKNSPIIEKRRIPVTAEKGVPLTIQDLSHDGRGIARLHGYTLFVPGALPGEEVQAVITRRKSRYGEARLLTIEKEAEERQHPPCPVFTYCGGCQLQHLAIPAQLEFKKKKLLQALERIGQISPVPPAQVHGTEPWYYRNKGTYHCHKGGKLGFFAPQSHNVIPHQECHIQRREMTRYKGELEERNLLDPGEGCTIRLSSTGEGMLILEKKKDPKKLAELSFKGIYGKKKGRIQHLSGEKRIQENLGSFIFQIPPTVFFQVHSTGRELLKERSQALLQVDKEDILLDLYCGVGALSLPYGEKVKRILGLDGDREAIQAARKTAQRWGYHHASFYHGRAEEKISLLLKAGPTRALLDPPREGCHPALLQELLVSSLQQILYISCDPATLARDLRILQEGFHLKRVEMVDMFPQTYHLECIVVLER